MKKIRNSNYFTTSLLALLLVFSTSQVNAALDFNQQLANRLETILTVYSTGSSKQVNSARQIYVRSKDSDVAVVKGLQTFLQNKGYYQEGTKQSIVVQRRRISQNK